MIALASDHGGFPLKNEIKKFLEELHFEYKDFGCDSQASCDYSDFGLKAAQAVAAGTCEKGIVICGTGAGMSYTANKVNGVRCVLCSDCYTAAMSREHNDANMLSLGGRVLGIDLAKMIVQTWLETKFSNDERHKRRIAKVMDIEKL
ncbi:MAG: ribose 5-phosphate isomerase B [Termitinemataceae bacterium]|nr:MAG: ribose 5-phosphate isomerase B [Termitinemataceae bacterium]